MSTRVERLQILVSKPELEEIQRLAEKTGQSLSALVREALFHFSQWRGGSQRRRSAFKQLIRLKAPVGDWKEIKQDLEDRYRG